MSTQYKAFTIKVPTFSRGKKETGANLDESTEAGEASKTGEEGKDTKNTKEENIHPDKNNEGEASKNESTNDDTNDGGEHGEIKSPISPPPRSKQRRMKLPKIKTSSTSKIRKVDPPVRAPPDIPRAPEAALVVDNDDEPRPSSPKTPKTTTPAETEKATPVRRGWFGGSAAPETKEGVPDNNAVATGSGATAAEHNDAETAGSSGESRDGGNNEIQTEGEPKKAKAVFMVPAKGLVKPAWFGSRRPKSAPKEKAKKKDKVKKEKNTEPSTRHIQFPTGPSLSLFKGRWTDVAPLDGKDRTKFPVQPVWLHLLKGHSLIVALVVTVLTAYAAAVLRAEGSGVILIQESRSSGLTFMSAKLVVLPYFYSAYVHLTVEALTNIFWLATFGALASAATTIARVNSRTYRSLTSSYRVALDCVRASAGVGALVWLLFCLSLIVLVSGVVKQRRPNTRPDLERGESNGNDGIAAEENTGKDSETAPGSGCAMQ